MPDVEVTLRSALGTVQTVRTDASGAFVFRAVQRGAWLLTTATADYDPTARELEVAEPQANAGEVVIYPALPAGQVKGRALDLRGNPVAATVVFEPGGLTLQVAADGSFTVDLKPGNYSVRVSHPDFATQLRSVRVEERGVIVLDIALDR
jgi:hypothetical protein